MGFSMKLLILPLFVISIIPHTFNNTNLQFSKEGDLVNVEFDYLARFILNKND